MWEVTHVGRIVDYSQTLNRSVLLTGQDNWSLTTTHDASGTALLQLSSHAERYEFTAPTQSLDIRLDGYGSSIVQTGTIELNAGSSFTLDSGASGTTIVQGSIFALGDDTHPGGTVTVTGHNVQLDSQAVIDVSGSRGGGVVLIGGDQAGANASVRNATSTFLAAGARVSADATVSGNGGRIVIYAIDRTRIDNASNLSARGSGLSGAGGFIETSGRRHLSLSGTPVLSSASGRAGQWLIDPDAISIVTAVPAIPDPNISYITVADLQTLINAGGDVILQTTTANPTLGDIVIDANITFTPGVSARLILQAARDIVFNGSITGNANLGLHLEAVRDINASTVSITGVDYVKAQSGGTARLNTVSVGLASANAGVGLMVDATTAIRLSGNLTTTGSSITLTGLTTLANDVVLTTQGNSAALSLGNVDTVGSATRNLQLLSDGNISVGGVDLHGGTLTTQVDANNDGIATFSTSAELKAGVLQINGSTAKNDSVIAQGKLTSTAGAIALNNFNLVQLFAISSSSTSFTASNVNTLELKAGANIDAAGAINLDSTVGGILLSGASGSQYQITATGSNAAVNLAPVTATNANVDLQISSARSASMKSITLTGGQVDVFYSVNNAANNSSANFTAAVTSDGLNVTGANRTNDAVTFSSTLTLGAAGLLVTQVNTAQLQGAVTSTTGDISLTTSGSTTLSNNLTTNGGSITIVGATQLAADATLTTQGNSGSLTVGSIDTVSSVARNLTLISDDDISLSTANLHGGTLSIQVDANNDGVASFTATNDLTAGVLLINGSAAKNDTASVQGLITTVGSVTLNNFNSAQLSGNSNSATDFTATNINTVELRTSANISSNGAINLDSTVGGVLLSGSTGTQNQLVATGANAAINLGAVTSTNNNVDLSISSARGVTLKSITLPGGQVDVQFSQNNPANNSTASFTAAINSDGLSVTGGNRTNDTVTFSSPLTLGGTGLSVTQAATVQVQGAVTTTSGNIAISASNATTLSANLSTAGSGSMNLSGSTLLASNIVLTTQGNGGSLTVGSVTASGGARDLQLISDGSISTTGAIDLLGGTLLVQVDANNDGVASFTSTNDLTAGVLLINGSLAKNDSMSAQGKLKSTVGVILLKNFNQAQLTDDSTSQTDFTATDVTSVVLGSGADITAAGVIALDSTVGGIVLSGNSGTQNQLVATGANAAINLGAVTSTNNNVDLSISSARGVTLKSITLTGGQVDVQFSQNDPANNSTANFTAAVTSDGLSVTGASRTNDSVLLSGPVVLAAAGLSVTNVANTQVVGGVTSTTGGIAIASSNTTTLASDLITSGGNITLSGARMIVDGAAARTIASGGSGGTAVTAGNIDLSGLTLIDGINAPGDVTISARGATTGGTVSLGNIVNTLLGLRNLTVDTRGSATIGQLVLNNGIAGSTSIVVSGNLNFINARTRLTDDVVLTTLEETSTLSLGSVSTDAARSLQLSSQSNISLSGVINLQGGGLTAQVDSNNNSVSSLISSADITAGTIQLNGSAAKNDTLSVEGLITTVGAVTLNNFNSAQLSGNSNSATDFTATNVNTVELRTSASISSNGAINLDSTVGGVLLSGSTGTQNQLVATGANAAINLGAVTSTNNNVDLSISSARGVTLKSITLPGGQVDVQFSQNNPANNSTASFTAAINSDGLSVTGGNRTNDTVTFSSPLTLGVAGLSVTQAATVQVQGAVTTTSGNIAISASNATTLSANLSTAGSGSMNLSGSTLLASNIVLTTQGNGGSLTVGSVTASGGARDLQLISDGSISTTGAIDLLGGTLLVQVDANNDGVASFTSTNDLTAGVLLINGSLAKNDSMSAQGKLKSTVGAILLKNFNQAQLTDDSTSQTDFTATDVTSLVLGSGADITAAGVIALDSTVGGIVLSGNSGTQNQLVATGANAAINLGAVTSTNNNVDLSISSARGVTLKSITLTGGQVDVQFSQNDPANNSTASFTAAVTSDGLSVTGASRTNDSVLLSGPVVLAAAGLSVTNVANTQVVGGVTTTTGGIAIASSNTTTLASDLTTSGGNITLSGTRMIVDGAAARTIASGGSGGTAVTAGNIDLSGLTLIDGINAPGDVTISARGATTGGTVSLGNIVNTLLGLRNLTVDTRGSATIGQLVLNNGIAGSTSIVVSGNLNFINARTRLTDDVVLTTLEETSTLSLGSVSTDAARSLQLSSQSNISLSGVINLQGGGLTAQVDSNNNSVSSLISSADITAGTIQLNGSAAKNDTLSVEGLITTVGSVTLNNFNSAQLSGNSNSATDFTATNVNTVELRTSASISSNGAINLDSTVGGVLLSGSTGTQNQLVATGANAAINLGAVTSTNNNVDLSISSARGVTLKSITLPGGQVDVQFSQNNPANNSAASFTAAINSDGLSVTGGNRTNDTVTFSSPLTLGVAGLSVTQAATVQFNGDVNSTGSVAVNQISNRIQLVQNGRIVSAGDVDLRTGVALLELLGGAGTLNQIVSSGDSATVQLSNTTATSGSNLDVLSNRNVVLGNVDLTAAGRLQVEIDRNNNNAGSTLIAGNLRAASMTLMGSTTQNDTATLNGTIQSLSGDVTVRQFETVTINGDTISASALTVIDVAQQLRLGFGADMLAGNGDLLLLPSQIVFVGPVGSTHTLDARGAMNLAPLSSLNTVGVFLLANSDVQLAGSNLLGNLVITSGNNGALTGRIESSQQLTASILALSSASGIGTISPLLTSANSLSANTRVSGDIRITNQGANTSVNNLSTVAGGNILFRQFGGSATFFNVQTTADATPAANENQVTLEVTGADLSLAASPLLSDGVGAIRLQTVTAGNVTVQSDIRTPAAAVTLSSAQNILGSGITNGQSVRLEAVQAIGSPTGLRTETTQLSTQTLVGDTNVANSSPGTLNVTSMQSLVGGAITLVQSGGGDVAIGDVVTGNVPITGPSNVTLLNAAGSLVINGQVTAGGEGALNLQTQQNLLLTSTSQLKTTGENALIQAAAAGRIQFQPGAVVRAGAGTPTTEAVVTQLPPLVQVIAVVNSIGVNVDTDGVGVIDILLSPSGTGVLDRNYDLTIDWGGGEIDRLPLGPTNANTTPTGVNRFDASPTAYRVSHLYRQNPNTSDPSANIPVRVTAQVDSLNRIRFVDSQGIAQRLSASSDAELVVPSTGLVSLYFVLPQTPTIQKQLAFARDNTELPVARVVASDRSELPVSTTSVSSVQTQRKIVLRVMTPVDEFGRVEASKDAGEDVTLTPEDVANLDTLFARLSDNRYRIYIIMEDGNEILLKDILLRNHQPAEIEDASGLREIDRTNIPLLDEAPSTTPTPPAELQESSATNKVSQREDAPDESNVSVFRSWRKAARRFRAG